MISGLFFVASGFCSLLYQVVWTRLAFSRFGIIHPVLSTVVSTFMLGNALGAWLGGRWVDARPARSAGDWLRLYGLTELGIGTGAWAVPRLFAWGERWLATLPSTHSFSYLAGTSLVLVLALIPWCFAMGLTLPLMMGFIRRSWPDPERSFSWLYLANVLGAALGTLLTALVLVEALGFRGTLAAAGLANALIAVGAGALSIRSFAPSAGQEAPPSPARPRANGSSRLILLLFLTGFISLADEVVWTRLFTAVLGTTIYAFAAILTVYLLATFAGTALYRWQARGPRPWPIGYLALAAAATGLLPLLMNDPRLGPGAAQTLLSIVPFCALCGFLTPYLVDIFSRGDPAAAGRAYAINTAGCIAGPLLASYFLLPIFGSRITLLLGPFLLMLAGLVFEGVPRSRRWIVGLAGAVIVAGAGASILTFEEPTRWLDPSAQVRRDEVATVISLGHGMNKRLIVNGVGLTELTPITKEMAHLPLSFLSHPPASALDICFGMGTTYRSLLSWGIRTVGVELVPSVADAFPYYHADAARVLSDPNGRIVIDDGRRFLRRTTDQFDVITIDPPPPVEAAGSSLLYSREFYELAKKHLKPGGILAQWFPPGEEATFRAVTQTLRQSFRYGVIYKSPWNWGFHFLASEQPIQPPTVRQILARMPERARRDLVEWDGDGNAERHAARLIATPLPPGVVQPRPGEWIDDDHPFNEYYWLRRNVRGFSGRERAASRSSR